VLSFAKMAAPIKMPFTFWTRVSQRNPALDGGPDLVM